MRYFVCAAAYFFSTSSFKQNVMHGAYLTHFFYSDILQVQIMWHFCMFRPSQLLANLGFKKIVSRYYSSCFLKFPVRIDAWGNRNMLRLLSVNCSALRVFFHLATTSRWLNPMLFWSLLWLGKLPMGDGRWGWSVRWGVVRGCPQLCKALTQMTFSDSIHRGGGRLR